MVFYNFIHFDLHLYSWQTKTELYRDLCVIILFSCDDEGNFMA